MKQKKVTMQMVMVPNREPVGGDAPERILVVPWGSVQSKNFGFVIDQAAADAILAAFLAHGVDLPIDLDHQTVGGPYASPDGSAPAMGWIKELEIVAGEGIFARVAWTARGKAHIEAGEYRYVSPVLLLREQDRAVRQLHSVALTNKPAIVGIRAIVQKEELIMASEDIFERSRWFLNLPATATEGEIMGEFEKFLAQLREKLGIDAEADTAAVMSAVEARAAAARSGEALRRVVIGCVGAEESATVEALSETLGRRLAGGGGEPDPARYVPMAQYVADTKALREQFEALSKDQRTLKVEGFIAQGYSEGRISRAQEPQWRAKYLDDPAGAEATLQMIPEGTFPRAGQQLTPHGEPGAGAGAERGGDRQGVIARARREFAAGREEILRICSDEAAYVMGCLAEAGLGHRLSEEEKKLLAS